MDPAEQTKAFDQIAAKAKRAGLLRYHNHGLVIVTLPDAAKQPPGELALQPSAPVAPAPLATSAPLG